jgi:hypothetical protein
VLHTKATELEARAYPALDALAAKVWAWGKELGCSAGRRCRAGRLELTMPTAACVL